MEFNKNGCFNFVKNKYEQKLWSEALLRFTKMDLHHMSVLLSLTAYMLSRVYRQEHYFSDEYAEILGQLFYWFVVTKRDGGNQEMMPHLARYGRTLRNFYNPKDKFLKLSISLHLTESRVIFFNHRRVCNLNFWFA